MSAIPGRVRARMLLRSFAVQGSWNYETLIGAGFAFAVLPALRHLHEENPEALNSAVIRHAGLFNSHPYFTTVALGAVARLEAQGADPAVIERFKTALRGSLGSMGDRLFWTGWRPMSVLLGLAMFFAGVTWWVAIGTFLLVYNSLHLWVRVVGLRMGIDSGLEVGRLLREAPLQPLIERASRGACLLVGLAIVFAAVPSAGNPVGALAAILAVAGGILLGLRTRAVMIAILVGVTALALAYGLMGNGA